jgi:hypothetical protein
VSLADSSYLPLHHPFPASQTTYKHHHFTNPGAVSCLRQFAGWRVIEPHPHLGYTVDALPLQRCKGPKIARASPVIATSCIPGLTNHVIAWAVFPSPFLHYHPYRSHILLTLPGRQSLLFETSPLSAVIILLGSAPVLSCRGAATATAFAAPTIRVPDLASSGAACHQPDPPSSSVLLLRRAYLASIISSPIVLGKR